MQLATSRGTAVFAAILAVFTCHAVAQTTVNLGTAGGASRFVITGAGATAATALQVGNSIALTSNGFRTGTFVTGGSLASFNGFFYADEQFTIPSDATNISLTFSGLAGDDRVVLQLNGTTLGSVGVLGVSGPGFFSFPPGPPDVNYTLTGITSGTVNSGFNAGGTNTLRLIVNNTGGGGAFAHTATFGSDGDGCGATLVAALTYQTPVTPLPPGMWFAFAGLLLLIGVQALFRRPAWR